MCHWLDYCHEPKWIVIYLSMDSSLVVILMTPPCPATLNCQKLLREQRNFMTTYQSIIGEGLTLSCIGPWKYPQLLWAPEFTNHVIPGGHSTISCLLSHIPSTSSSRIINTWCHTLIFNHIWVSNSSVNVSSLSRTSVLEALTSSSGLHEQNMHGVHRHKWRKTSMYIFFLKNVFI